MGTKKIILPLLGVFFLFAPSAFAATIYQQPTATASHFSPTINFYPIANGTLNHIRIYPTSTNSGDYIFAVVNFTGGSHTSPQGTFSYTARYLDNTPKTYIDLYFDGSNLPPTVNDYTTFGGSNFVSVGICTNSNGSTSCNGNLTLWDNNTQTSWTGFGNLWNAYTIIDGTTPGPPPPTTEFNEVSYIPASAINGSAGTTTVGASFSLPNVDYTEYVGYRITNPAGTVVYNATTTTAVPGTYEISTSYNFTQAGLYIGQAYFYSTSLPFQPGVEGEINSGGAQQIIIDTSTWAIGTDGGFTNNPFESSTSTLGELTLDCSGINFPQSICNLIALVIIPQANTIQGIQGAFGTMMQKSPFNFFTEAHTVLGALNGTVGTQQTLSLNLFGAESTVLAASTTASIGLGDTQIDFLKFLMVVGLWILFAWFLYWRIASIFGV